MHDDPSQVFLASASQCCSFPQLTDVRSQVRSLGVASTVRLPKVCSPLCNLLLQSLHLVVWSHACDVAVQSQQEECLKD